MYVDVHCHLDKVGDVAAVIKMAGKAGVSAIITNGIDAASNRASLALAKQYSIVKTALGLYPLEALKMKEEEIDEEIAFIKKNNPPAIGEVGLDMHWVKDKLAEQKRIFEKFIGLAERLDVPIIVHSRKAEQECIEMLESSDIRKVVMHCFGGTLQLAKKAYGNGWSFSIPSNVVNSSHFQRIAEEVNINNLLTETDAPYLSPFKDKPSEPAFVVEAVKKIAEIKGFEVEEVMNNIFMNYRRLFG